MATKEIISNIITLPLIALCLPLFVEDRLTAEHGCPYETYLRVDNKCLDISEQGLNDLIAKLDTNSIEKVDREIEDVSKELEELSAELKEFCVKQQPETSTQKEIIQDVCQY
jgi:predicted transcriptional regulator